MGDAILSASLLPDEAPLNDAKPEAPEEREQEQEQQQATILQRFLRVVGFSLLYLLFLLPITYFCHVIPPSNLFSKESVLGKWITVWPWSTFFIWNLALICGYTFVACFTEKRKNPFKSRFGNYHCFLKILASSPIVYIVGPVRALHFSSSSLPSSPLNSSPFHAFLYNTVFLVSFFVGVQFTYLDYIMLFRTAGDKFGTPSLWKTYNRSELFMIIPLILSVLIIVGYHLYLIGTEGLLLWYFVFYCILFLSLIVPTVICRKSYYLHMHHYVIFGVLIPFFAFPNPVSLICLGIMTGVYVEGISRWGMAWIWYKGAQRVYGE